MKKVGIRPLWQFMVLAAFSVGWTTAKIFPKPFEGEDSNEYWLDLGRKELNEALEKPELTNVAKNIILFLGDGMGVTVTTAGRIFKGQKNGHSGEEGFLLWEKFPNMGLLKTYNIDRQVSDSASSGTAYLSGVKGNYKTIGVNGKVKFNDCQASLKKENRVTSILEWAQEAQKETGFVTNTQVTHATPGGLYAKSANRKWQCDRKLKEFGDKAEACKDIARQLVEDEPGKNIKVIMGGGRQELGVPKSEDEPDKCKRTDGLNLVEYWKNTKKEGGHSYAYVTTTQELRDVNVNNTEYIMGLFADLHLPNEIDKEDSLESAPHIKEMVEVAIKRLSQSENGFFLLVEGGRIDLDLHSTLPRRALEEVLAFEMALEVALKMVNLEETLIIVTADHSHVMTINGYPYRGNDILGIHYDDEDISDGLPFSTIMFTNGPGFNYSWNGNEVVRQNLTGIDTAHKDFVSPSAVPTYAGSETHGGEDVAAFALGPMAHLFHHVHEQTHVANVMAFAACIGPYNRDCNRPAKVPACGYKDPEDQMKAQFQGLSSKATSTYLGLPLIAFTCISLLMVPGI